MVTSETKRAWLQGISVGVTVGVGTGVSVLVGTSVSVGVAAGNVSVAVSAEGVSAMMVPVGVSVVVVDDWAASGRLQARDTNMSITMMNTNLYARIGRLLRFDNNNTGVQGLTKYIKDTRF
jgi:hypothetical protein